MKIPNTSAHGRGEPSQTGFWQVARRDFLKASSLLIAHIFDRAPCARAGESDRIMHARFGIVTDAHFADVDARGSRYYRASMAKMTECVALMNEQKVDFLIELGDFKDQGTPAREQETRQYLVTIEKVFRRFEGPRYHVLGNHDVDSISKAQFQATIENSGIPKGATYYTFDTRDLHFLVLDANYSADGGDYNHGRFDWTDTNIPPQELDWIRKDLASTTKPVIVFIHQQLDGTGSHTVKNAAEVRHILQKSKRVLAVFQGHNHAGQYSQIEGIHYYTLKAMVEGSDKESNSFAIVEMDAQHNLVVNGYRKAVQKRMDYQA
jgi:predicted phosphodiesterase